MFIANGIDRQPDAIPISAWTRPPQGTCAVSACAQRQGVLVQGDGPAEWHPHVTNTRNNFTDTYRPVNLSTNSILAW